MRDARVRASRPAGSIFEAEARARVGLNDDLRGWIIEQKAGEGGLEGALRALRMERLPEAYRTSYPARARISALAQELEALVARHGGPSSDGARAARAAQELRELAATVREA